MIGAMERDTPNYLIELVLRDEGEGLAPLSLFVCGSRDYPKHTGLSRSSTGFAHAGALICRGDVPVRDQQGDTPHRERRQSVEAPICETVDLRHLLRDRAVEIGS